jgi:hypothetical protein
MSPSKKNIDKLSVKDLCIASRLIRKELQTEKTLEDKISFIDLFVDGLSDKIYSEKTDEKMLLRMVKEVSKWLEKADDKCSTGLYKQGFKTKEEQKYYIDIQMLYEK